MSPLHLRVLYLVCQGKARFGELVRAAPGLSGRVLTEQLRELADQALLRRIVEDGPPTRITYCPTGRGPSCAPR
ncbi:winged helix-turn-helix transcriptional regulator [Streptosporangium sp. DT93]|uniref:winged helix-turn-helix transcriptional regulator n=1 Tax=Streptosporangium sp. DT93 TaxID=3393428 RepID=UPI003CEE6FB9